MRKHAKYRDLFFAEVLQHLWNGIQGSSMFYGREAELGKICRGLIHACSILGTANEYLRSSNDQPMIFYGEHGCGKTSILARIATEARKWLGTATRQDDYVLIAFGAPLNWMIADSWSGLDT